MGNVDLKKYLAAPSDTIRKAIELIDRNKDGIVLVVEKEKLVGTITDGDIRRFLLNGRSVEELCEKVMWKTPTTALAGSTPEELRALLKKYRLTSIPLVDKEHRPVGVVSFRDLWEQAAPESHFAVIMAGGEGKRLRPITESIPKPMIEVGGKPVLENIVTGLAKSGIKDIQISLNYRGDIIENHFGDGSRFGVSIGYLREEKKLGTAGALSLLPSLPARPFLVMNGDVMTNVNYQRMFEFHKQHRAAITVAATMYHFRIPYGVLETAGQFVMGLKEKPSQNFLCNAGIYIVDPEMVEMIPQDESYDMIHLMDAAMKEGLPVAAFPIHEYWLDIGQKEDLDKARKEALSMEGAE